VLPDVGGVGRLQLLLQWCGWAGWARAPVCAPPAGTDVPPIPGGGMPGSFSTLEELGGVLASLIPTGPPRGDPAGEWHSPMSPCPPTSPSCPGTRSGAGCPPPSPGAVWGRGAGAPPHLAAERQGRAIPTRLPDSRQGLRVLGGTSLPPPGTCLAEDGLILQQHQHRAADLHPLDQTPAEGRAGDPLLGPYQAGRAGGAPGRTPARTRWGGSCCARRWRCPRRRARLAR